MIPGILRVVDASLTIVSLRGVYRISVLKPRSTWIPQIPSKAAYSAKFVKFLQLRLSRSGTNSVESFLDPFLVPVLH